MDVFWSASTTMRNPERTLNFLELFREESDALAFKNNFLLQDCGTQF